MRNSFDLNDVSDLVLFDLVDIDFRAFEFNFSYIVVAELFAHPIEAVFASTQDPAVVIPLGGVLRNLLFFRLRVLVVGLG